MSHPYFKTIGSPEIRLIEECAELIMAISKAQRFGYFASHPDFIEKNNMDDILNEMNDVSECIKSMKEHLEQIKREAPNAQAERHGQEELE